MAGVREHDLEVTEQARNAEENVSFSQLTTRCTVVLIYYYFFHCVQLGNALADSEKNAK